MAKHYCDARTGPARLVEADAVRSAEGILHTHTEGPRP